MFSRYIEYFEGDNGRLSMTRLLCFMSFFPATWVVVQDGSENTLGWYLGAYVLGYVGGKGFDAMTNKAPDVSVPDAETVNVKSSGDVTVSQRKKK